MDDTMVYILPRSGGCDDIPGSVVGGSRPEPANRRAWPSSTAALLDRAPSKPTPRRRSAVPSSALFAAPGTCMLCVLGVQRYRAKLS